MRTPTILIQYLSCILVLIVFSSCEKQPEKITNKNDYTAYLEGNEKEKLTILNKDYSFWNDKLERHPDQFPYLVKKASAANGIFQQTGKIAKLKEAETDLISANEKTNYINPSYLRALSRNYISQHRFKESLELLLKAEKVGDQLKSTQKMLFDVYLELGNIDQAASYLEKIKDLSDFDYLIRVAKWSDHQGNLDATIDYMEKATIMAEQSNLASLKQWCYTNIADYYGHDGQIKNSYEHYLKALEIDPSNAYALKGIAWIVYSYEGNTDEALRIMNAIKENHNAPDYELFIAELAASKNDKALENVAMYRFRKAIENEDYGVMYAAHLCEVLLEEDAISKEEAILLAEQEVAARPTAMSYDLLAWAHFKNNDLDTAIDYADTYVKGKTHEPIALFHLANIYKADGRKDLAMQLKAALLEASFELGPLMTKEIKQL